MVDVFIVGSKGIPAQYGGFETFVENLTKRKKSEHIMYHVSCMNNDEQTFMYNNSECFNVKLPLKGAPGRILHVSRVLSKIEKWKKHNKLNQTIVYILGCRIGPLLIPHAIKLKRLGVSIMVNPDGLEWKRDKWSSIEKKFLKYCEKCLVKNSQYIICDSKNIEKYIQREYGVGQSQTTFIAYGADIIDTTESIDDKEKLNEWYKKYTIKSKEYFLIVGRFVPENNYETMIKEFMKSNTSKDLVIISNVENNEFYKYLENETQFKKDNRIKFVGTVYDQELLKMIRKNAFAYIHGHEVGGTNPSLLEALGSTSLNLLLDVGFNKEVAENGALYWSKDDGALKTLIEKSERLDNEEICEFGEKAKKRIKEEYSWTKICKEYENTFLEWFEEKTV